MWASATTWMCLDWAREILELRMASVMGLPVLMTWSTLVRSWSSRSRYWRMASQSPAAA